MSTRLDDLVRNLGRVHGGPRDDELRALKIDPARLLDFSVNTNPYGPAPGVVAAIRSAPVDRYPDPTARAAREVMARCLDVSPDELALGNGAAELMWTLAHALLRPSSTVLIVEPTFSEFRAAALAAGARICEWRAVWDNRFAIELEAIAALMHVEKPDAVYLCVPNTPTGTSLPAPEIAQWAEAHPDSIVVLDQSFLSLSQRFDDASTPMPPNVIRIRSLTKEHAIPGVRVGYLIASVAIVARLEPHRPAWTTSTMAQAAASAACHEQMFVNESRRKILADRKRLSFEMERLGYPTVSSTAGFVLVQTGQASELRKRLLARHHILVRDCTSFGLAEFTRLAARPVTDCLRLASALREESARC